jgi:ABC-type branched-subunit amino acid transport system substrate-binding protein/serine/threonine protein kinase
MLNGLLSKNNMSYCINPGCKNRDNSDDVEFCESCQTPLIINNRYRLIKRLACNGKTSTEVLEVEDKKYPETLKIIKVIASNNSKLIELFQREHKVVTQLEHQGIPKGEEEFSFFLSNNQELRCLVMEKIPGWDLQKWLKQNGAINQEQAIDWLRQMAIIIKFIHDNRLFHRDIKPSNIMIRPNGRLVLIDFNTVREISETVINGGDITAVSTYSYTPPEQLEGCAVPQSDFFALGRTFVHLLTGKNPSDIKPNISHWRKKTRYKICDPLAVLIDEMMAIEPQNRPQNAQQILKRLTQIEGNQIEDEKNNRDEVTVSGEDTNRWGFSFDELGDTTTRLSTRSTSRNQRRKVLLIGGLALASVFLGGMFIVSQLFPFKDCNANTGDNLSCGEETLISGDILPEKKQGIQAIKDGDYAKAVSFLESAWKKEKQNKQLNPETLIYLNNSRINQAIKEGIIPPDKVYAIAVITRLSVLGDKDSAEGLGMLRGVAQLQNEVVQQGIGLKVLIASDANDEKLAANIASKLVKRKDILAVIGHITSDITKKVLPIYEQHRVVLISPSAVSAELINDADKDIKDIFFFRTVANAKVQVEALRSYLLKQPSQKKTAILWSPGSYSRSVRDEFSQVLSDKAVDLDERFYLSNADFDASDALKQAKQEGATSILLIPPGGMTQLSLENAVKVIKSNNSQLLILGATTLESRLVLTKEAVNRFVVIIPWYDLSSTNPKFLNEAQKLWDTKQIGWRIPLAYDAALVLAEAIKQQPQPSREGIQLILSSKTFKPTGATGEIQFERGDRKTNPSQLGYVLVKVVPKCDNPNEFAFVPIEDTNKCLRSY